MAGGELIADDELPRDAKLVKSILRSMGVKQHEPRVVQQFLDFWYRYVVEVLGDAQLYSEHAGKSAIDCDDLKLSIQSRASFSFSQPPPRETLMELARIRNSVPLPKAISGPSIALPPEQDMLVAANYQISVPTKTVDDMEAADGGNQTPTTSGQTPATSAERNGMPPPASQHMDQDGSRKVSFSLAGNKRLHSQV